MALDQTPISFPPNVWFAASMTQEAPRGRRCCIPPVFPSHSMCAVSQPWFRGPREPWAAGGLQFTSMGALGLWPVETLAPDSRAEGSERLHHQNINYPWKNRLAGTPN